MSGRSGKYNEETGKYENIIYLPVTVENNFKPELPKEKVDIIYLCFPNNPTGTVLTKQELKEWIDYAKENKAIILYDSAYEAFIEEENIPHSIYEIEGTKEVAIEFKSFSKTAGFTGVRCAYTVVPKQVKGYTKEGEEISLNKLWNRRKYKILQRKCQNNKARTRKSRIQSIWSDKLTIHMAKSTRRNIIMGIF